MRVFCSFRGPTIQTVIHRPDVQWRPGPSVLVSCSVPLASYRVGTKCVLGERVLIGQTCNYSTLEVNIAIICSCMPAFTAPLRTLTTRMTSSWRYLKRSTDNLLSRKDTSAREPGQEGLPEVPRANISGLRTFIRRFNRSASEETAVAVDMSNFSKLGSVDEDYHQQLRALHVPDSRAPSRPNTSGKLLARGARA